MFIYERSQSPEVFEAGRQTLHLTFGAVNTMLLLSGSLLVVRALAALRRFDLESGRRWLLAAMACGGAFVVNKVIEYQDEIHAGHGPGDTDFFMYLFMFTGIHLVHLLVGLLALAVR